MPPGPFDLSKAYHFLEFFAGTANVSKMLLRSGYVGASVDILYNSNMDINSDQGMAW